MINRPVNLLDFLLLGGSKSSSSQFPTDHPQQPEFWTKRHTLLQSIVREKEIDLFAAMKQGDEQAFMALVDRYHSALMGFAQTFVDGEDKADTVVRNTWQAVLERLN